MKKKVCEQKLFHWLGVIVQWRVDSDRYQKRAKLEPTTEVRLLHCIQSEVGKLGTKRGDVSREGGMEEAQGKERIRKEK